MLKRPAASLDRGAAPVVYRAELAPFVVNDFAAGRPAAPGRLLKVAKGGGQSRRGEPAWPNEIFYVFPVVTAGAPATAAALACAEPGGQPAPASAFATPREILPEWYFWATFNVLRTLEDKAAGVLALAALPLSPPAAPFAENPAAYQNPLRRPAASSSALSPPAYAAPAAAGAAAPLGLALPWR